MDDPASLPGYQRRVAQVEQQLAELQAEVAELKRLLSQSGPSSGCGKGSGLPGGEGATLSPDEPSTDVVASADHAEVVLTIVAPAAHRDLHLAYGDPQDCLMATGAETRGRPIVLVDTSPELADRAHAHPEQFRWHAASLMEGVQEQLSQAVAGSLVDAVWGPLTAPWQVTDFGGFENLSGLVDALDNWSHEETGNWASQLCRLGGVPASAADGAGMVIQYTVPLPVDQPLGDLSRGIQVAGIAVFAVAGGHVVAAAALKGLVHDKVTDFVAEKVRNVIWHGTDGPRPEPGTPGEPEGRVMHEPGMGEGKSPGPVGPASAAGLDGDMKDLPRIVSSETL